MRRSRFPWIVTVAVMLFFYLPILVLVVNSFNASRFGTTWQGWTLGWYGRLAGEREIKKALRKSLFKYKLHADEELFEKAYSYIRQYY